MTLTLDEVRKTKFHMARRTGYEVSEVDLFVDRVEASFAQLTEENQMLKQQVETLKQAQQNAQQRDDRRESANDERAEQQRAEQQRAEQQRLEQQRAEQQRAEQQRAAQQQARTSQPVAQAASGSEKIVVTTSAEASPAVVRLVQLATEQAESLVSEAQGDAKRKVDEATQKAHQITTDARTKADRVESEARVNAERMTNDAKTKADNLERETASRRTQLFSDLESERDRLRDSVNQLRSFEASYRQNFTAHLKQAIANIDSGRIEPSDKPGLLDRSKDDRKDDEQPSGRRSFGANETASSSTPRLDALLGDNNQH